MNERAVVCGSQGGTVRPDFDLKCVKNFSRAEAIAALLQWSCYKYRIDEEQRWWLIWPSVGRLTSYSADHPGCFIPNDKETCVVIAECVFPKWQTEVGALCLPVRRWDPQSVEGGDVSRCEGMNWFKGRIKQNGSQNDTRNLCDFRAKVAQIAWLLLQFADWLVLGLPEGGADEVDGIGVQSIDMYLSFDFSVDCFPSLPATECKRHESVVWISQQCHWKFLFGLWRKTGPLQSK